MVRFGLCNVHLPINIALGNALGSLQPRAAASLDKHWFEGDV